MKTIDIMIYETYTFQIEELCKSSFSKLLFVNIKYNAVDLCIIHNSELCFIHQSNLYTYMEIYSLGKKFGIYRSVYLSF